MRMEIFQKRGAGADCCSTALTTLLETSLRGFMITIACYTQVALGIRRFLYPGRKRRSLSDEVIMLTAYCIWNKCITTISEKCIPINPSHCCSDPFSFQTLGLLFSYSPRAMQAKKEQELKECLGVDIAVLFCQRKALQCPYINPPAFSNVLPNEFLVVDFWLFVHKVELR